MERKVHIFSSKKKNEYVGLNVLVNDLHVSLYIRMEFNDEMCKDPV